MTESRVIDLSALGLPDALGLKVMDLSTLDLPDARPETTAPSDTIPEFAQENYPKIGRTPLDLLQGTPRPPERLLRENAPKFLQDTWDQAEKQARGGAPLFGPLRQHPLRPDLREGYTLAQAFGLDKTPPQLLLPSERTTSEELPAGIAVGLDHVVSNILSAAYMQPMTTGGATIPAPVDMETPLNRQKLYQDTYDAFSRILNVKDLAEPENFAGALFRGMGESVVPLIETLLLSAATGGATAPAWAGLATRYPTFAAKAAPIVNNALTLGAQGALAPAQPGTQAAEGATVGTVLGATSPYGRIPRTAIGAALGTGQEYLSNPNATPSDITRNAALMAGFAGLAADRGLPLDDTIAGTIWDWARNKGYTFEQMERGLRLNGIGAIVDEFAEDMTGKLSEPHLEIGSGEIASIGAGESGAYILTAPERSYLEGSKRVRKELEIQRGEGEQRSSKEPASTTGTEAGAATGTQPVPADAGPFTTIGKAFREIETKPVQIVGQQIRSFADLAELAQGWRNPNYEELRYVFVKRGVIVDHEGVTCMHPGYSITYLGDFNQYIEHLQDRIKTLGADRLYMVHNHPNGDPTPSSADIWATTGIAMSIPEFKGHIIINSGKYGYISSTASTWRVHRLPNLPEDWIDPILQPSVPHELLGENPVVEYPDSIRKDVDIGLVAGWAKALTKNRNMPVLIYLGSDGKVRGLQEVHTDAFLNMKLMTEKMQQKLVDFGSVGAVVGLPESLSEEMLDAVRYYVREHILWDGVGTNPDGPFAFAGDLSDEYLGGRHKKAFTARYVQ